MMTTRIYFDTEVHMIDGTEMDIFTYVMDEMSTGKYLTAVVTDAESGLTMYEVGN